MTREGIIKLAQKAGFYLTEKGDPLAPVFLRFAALVAEAEREACAKIADSQIKNLAVLAVKPGKSAAAWDIANAIRARGSKT
jgi:hypothetical protein